jgi:hypothetical protein
MGMNLSKYAAAAVLTSFVLSPGLAAAAPCSQTNLTGDWRFYMVLTAGTNWMTCTFSVATNGSITAKKQCFGPADTKFPVLAGGNLQMSKPGACAVTGSVPFGGSSPMTVALGSARMALDHYTAVGTGTYDPNGHFFFYLTKLP